MDHQNSVTSSTRSAGGDGGSSVWRRLTRPSVVLAVGSPIVLLVDIGLVIVFLLRENWQGVVYSGVAFLAWTQVIFWFFRSRPFIYTRHQVNGFVCCRRLHFNFLKFPQTEERWRAVDAVKEREKKERETKK